MTADTDVNTDVDVDVDIVITWVNGSDPAWRAKRDLWQKRIQPNAPSLPTGNVEGRYRDNGELRYLLRSIECYWPGYQKRPPRIFLVTDNQAPSWLNRAHPQLHLIDHKDIIEEKYLPLFCSQAIEAGLHHIPGLSERFVYFNDDLFLSRSVDTKLFFGHSGALFPISGKLQPPVSGRDLFSDEHAVQNSNQWITQHYGSSLPLWVGAHAPKGLIRSRLFGLEKKHPQLFHKEFSQRFRSSSGPGITSNLYFLWCIATGQGDVSKPPVLYIENCAEDAEEKYQQGLNNPEQWFSIAINDTGDNRTDMQYEVSAMLTFLEARFPTPSCFEKLTSPPV